MTCIAGGGSCSRVVERAVVPPGPSAVADGGHGVDLFYRGPNGHLWTNWWDGRLWSAPTDLGGVELSSEPPAIAGGP
jgi:hypothetical protein